jgi:hypothetical protein
MQNYLCNTAYDELRLLWLEVRTWRHRNKALHSSTFNGKGRDIGFVCKESPSTILFLMLVDFELNYYFSFEFIPFFSLGIRKMKTFCRFNLLDAKD